MNTISINTKNLQTLYKDYKVMNYSLDNGTEYLRFEYIYTKIPLQYSSDEYDAGSLYYASHEFNSPVTYYPFKW